MATMPSSVPSPFSATTAIDRFVISSKPREAISSRISCLPLEVTVRRRGGDARDPAGVGKREVLRAALLHELARRPDQRLAQLPMMIAEPCVALFLLCALFMATTMDASRGIEKLASLTLCDVSTANIC